jgi:nucleotide-binding universal stress UspA family protein
MYKRILVPLDGSDTSERGLREAIGLAVEQKAKLVLLHVVDDFPLMMEGSAVASFQEMRTQLTDYGERLLAKAKAAATDAGAQADTVMRELTAGRIADVIVEEAANQGCDLIVIGTHGRRGLSRMALGSDAELVARASPVPVLLVRHA